MRRWLLLGVAALGVAGLFAAMLANTRSAYFYTALVAHVDLSVLVWFLSCTCMLVAGALPWGSGIVAGKAGFYSMATGSVLIAVSAFSHGTPFQNNYVPVIYHPLFFIALGLIFCGVMCVVAPLLLARQTSSAMQPVRVGILSTASLLLIAAFCFVWSYHSMTVHERNQEYYDDLFWAGGHVLQIAYTQIMVVAWFWLAEAAGIKIAGGRRIVLACYAAGVLVGLAAMALCVFFPVSSARHREMFTLLMKHGNGLPALLAGLSLLRGFTGTSAKKTARMAKISLVMSMLLFAVGGGLGYLIAGSTVTTPAHYHGSIVGVTLALMGLAYLLLPKLGFADVTGSKLAKLQPVLYGGGQLCWMMGMAIGGAYGIGRKIPGSADVIGGVGGFLKHGGDGLSLLGGLLFVWVVGKAATRKR